MKRLNEEQLKELTHIRDWCLTILDFMIDRYGQHHSFVTQKDLIIKIYNAQDLRGLRYIYRDSNEWGKNLPTLESTEELNKMLCEKFGKDLQACSKQNLLKIKKIIKRGNISNEREFRVVHNRVNEIYQDSTKKEEIEILNNLLSKFELSRNE
jgi:hypothetical protein